MLTLKCLQACRKRDAVPALSKGKRAWKPANWGPSLDVGMFDGFPDQADGLIDLDVMEEATLDLSAGSCRRSVRW